MFFFDDLYYDALISEAFYRVCEIKMVNDGYMDFSKYIDAQYTKEHYRNALVSVDSKFQCLFELAYPKSFEAFAFWQEISFGGSRRYFDRFNWSLKPIECEAIVYWIYKIIPNKKERMSFTERYFRKVKSFHDIINDIKHTEEVFYNSKKIDLRVVSSLARFNQDIGKLVGEASGEIFYRGHADINYVLQPSIMRHEKWMEHEHDMYNEIIIESPESFVQCKSHLEKLVEMQHYGLPTRLLDITRNPLVALFFACNSHFDKHGEIVLISSEDCTIKYPQSDCVSIIASLPVFSLEDKASYREIAKSEIGKNEFNKKIDRLIKEIRTEKPGFSSTVDKEDLLKSYIVLAVKKNRRIVNQDGAFILCGLLDKKDLLTQYRYKSEGKNVVIVVNRKNKKKIMDELKRCSIHHGKMFPEIECVSEYIKNKYY